MGWANPKEHPSMSEWTAGNVEQVQSLKAIPVIFLFPLSIYHYFIENDLLTFIRLLFVCKN